MYYVYIYILYLYIYMLYLYIYILHIYIVYSYYYHTVHPSYKFTYISCMVSILNSSLPYTPPKH